MTVSLQQRVTNILTSPNTEWPVIAGETETVGDLYTKYVVLLAAIGPAITLLGGSIRLAVLTYLMNLAATYICAWLIAWLGPRFSSSGSQIDALKLVAYASTPSWVAGILNLLGLVLPILGTLLASLVMLIGALYGIYLFFLGLTPVMKTPNEQRVPFMLVSAILVIVVFTLLSAVLGPIILGGALLTM